MNSNLAEVVTLYETNASSVVDMLRQAADNVEKETDEDDRTEAIVAVQITQSGVVEVYAWGKTDSVHALGVLHLGMQKIAGGVK